MNNKNILEEIRNLSSDDAELIIKDQKNLYTDEEIKVLSNELINKKEQETIKKINLKIVVLRLIYKNPTVSMINLKK
jgi:signal transduction histidine kinase